MKPFFIIRSREPGKLHWRTERSLCADSAKAALGEPRAKRKRHEKAGNGNVPGTYFERPDGTEVVVVRAAG